MKMKRCPVCGWQHANQEERCANCISERREVRIPKKQARRAVLETYLNELRWAHDRKIIFMPQ